MPVFLSVILTTNFFTAGFGLGLRAASLPGEAVGAGADTES